jgi:hypothetical protein
MIRKLIFFVIILLVLILFIWKNFVTVDRRNPDADALAGIKNAYTASQAYFTDYPDGTVSLSILKEFGYIQFKDVNLTVLSGGSSNLKMTAFHTKGKKIYTVDSRGNISQKRKW